MSFTDIARNNTIYNRAWPNGNGDAAQGLSSGIQLSALDSKSSAQAAMSRFFPFNFAHRTLSDPTPFPLTQTSVLVWFLTLPPEPSPIQLLFC